MIERYTREEMKAIWSLENKFQTYLDVELAVCDAYAQLGTLSDDIVKDIKSEAKFSDGSAITANDVKPGTGKIVNENGFVLDKKEYIDMII